MREGFSMRVMEFYWCRDLVPDPVDREGFSRTCNESLLHRAHCVARGSRMNGGVRISLSCGLGARLASCGIIKM